MSDDDTDDLRPEYPAELIRSGGHGKYARGFREDSNIVLIDPSRYPTLTGQAHSWIFKLPDPAPVRDATSRRAACRGFIRWAAAVLPW